jgi:hypothetical protein
VAQPQRRDARSLIVGIKNERHSRTASVRVRIDTSEYLGRHNQSCAARMMGEMLLEHSATEVQRREGLIPGARSPSCDLALCTLAPVDPSAIVSGALAGQHSGSAPLHSTALIDKRPRATDRARLLSFGIADPASPAASNAPPRSRYVLTREILPSRNRLGKPLGASPGLVLLPFAMLRLRWCC